MSRLVGGSASAAARRAREQRARAARRRPEDACAASRVPRCGRRGPARDGTARTACRAFSPSSWTRPASVPFQMRWRTTTRSNANTIGNVAERLGGLHLPNFERLGLGHITGVRGVSARGPRRRRRRPAARAQQGQGHDHRSLGDGRASSPRSRSRPIRDGFPPEVIERVHRDLRQAAAGQRAGLGDRDHRRAGRGAPARPAGRSSTPRPIRCSRSRRTKRPSRWRRSTTGASAPGRCCVPPHEVNRVIARPFVGLARELRAHAEPAGLCDPAAADGPRPAGASGCTGPCGREDL